MAHKGRKQIRSLKVECPLTGVGDAVQPSHPLLWPKYWSFSFSIGPSNEYLGLISVKTDSFDLLAVQGTLRSFLQHRSLKASVLWCSVFLMVQISHPYMTTGKTIALTIQTFVGKVMSLLFNTLSMGFFRQEYWSGLP